MSSKKNSTTNEYSEMLEFILELQEDALKQSDVLLSNKKELEYKKRQQEFLREEREKRRIPNISMFSPLNTEDMYEGDVAWKDEMEKISSELSEAESAWENQKKLCASYERLKKFFISMEEKTKAVQNDDLTQYSIKFLETQEMDRNRISRDLHDSTVQSLTSLGHKLELQSMLDLNKEIINDMREIIYDLRPMSLNNIGLISTIEAYCLHLRRYNNLDVVLKVEGEEKKLTSIVSVTLYRIIQEACNNAVRHSKAKNISIRIAYLNQNIELDIEDNGIGFHIEDEKKNSLDELHGFGLSTMRERARLLSGSFSIESKPGAGTKVKVIVPVNYTSGNEESL